MSLSFPLSWFFEKQQARTSKRKARRRSPGRGQTYPLVLQQLEDRLAPAANLTITNAFLVNSSGQSLTAVTVGEQVSVEADFTAQGLPSNASYRVGSMVNGLNLYTGQLTDGAGVSGMSSWQAIVGTFLATPGTNQVTATVDPDHSVTETTYADNSMNFTFTASSSGGFLSYTVAQIRAAYGLNSIPDFGSATPDGTGQTIALVEGANDPTILSDLDGFDQAMSLTTTSTQTLYQQYGPASSFVTVYNQSGQNITADIGTSGTDGVPPVDPTGGWEGEETLDVEWAHAIAPGAKIDIIEVNDALGSQLLTNDPDSPNLYAGDAVAASLPGVSVVSNSWGYAELSSETAYDSSTFVTPSGHTGVTFLASSGDGGADSFALSTTVGQDSSDPSASPNVVSVGGTQLTLNNNLYAGETGWSFGTPQTLNNGSAAYSQTGSWTADAGGFSGLYSTAPGGSSSSASWTTTLTQADVPDDGTEVSATWTPNSGNATDATYTIYDGSQASGDVIGTVTVNQTKAPDGTADGNSQFQELGVFYPTSGRLTVVLNAVAANGTVVADAVGFGPAYASGGGPSEFELEPSYQLQYQSTGFRTTPDVAFDASINSGVTIYEDGVFSYGNAGTSLASPCWAGLIAIANQGRVAEGGTTLNSTANPQQTLQALYSLPQSDFNEITSGYNGFNAGPGYNYVTGRGSPIANLLIPNLVAYGTTLTLSPTALPTGTVGENYGPVAITATGGSGSYTFALQSGSSLPPGMNALNSSGVLSGTPTQAGSYTFTIIATDPSEPAFTGNITYTLTIAAELTTTSGSNAMATFSTLGQSVTLSATVMSGGVGVNEGTVTFTLLGPGSVQVGQTATSGALNDGSASASFMLPAGEPAGTYTVQAVYNAGPDYLTSSDSTQTLTIGQAGTTTTVSNASASFTDSFSSVLLSATVSSPDGTVNEGTVTFTVFGSGSVQVGQTATSGALNDGSASASFMLPAGEPAGTYTVQAVYNAGPDYLTSSDSTQTLTIGQAGTTTAASNASASFTDSFSSVLLSATVSSPIAAVNQGTVTFTVLNGSTVIGTQVTSGTVSDGTATADFDLPAGTPPGDYELQVLYDDIGGNFNISSNVANPASLAISQAATTAAVSPVVVPISSTSETVALHATVASAGGTVGGGTITFAVLEGQMPLGSAVVSSTVSGGAATATYTVPAGTPAGSYAVQATYSAGTDYQASQPATNTFIVDAGPSLAVIPPVTALSGQFPVSVPLDVTDLSGLPLTYSTTVVGDNPLFDLQQQYQFSGVGYFNAGAAAYVLHSNASGSGVGGYYLIRPSDGAVFPYDGSGSYASSFAHGTPLTLNPLGSVVYTDPTLLLDAQPPANYATLLGLQLQYEFTGVGYFNAGAAAYVLHSDALSPGVDGYYLIRPSDGAVFPYDGSGSYASSFAHETPLAILGSNIYSFPNELIDAEATPSLYAQLYQVNRQFDLQEYNGSFYTDYFGNNAEWLYSPVLNQYGEHWYTLLLSGGNSVLHAWEGYSDSSVGAVVATFDTPAVYADPVLLTTATFLPDPPAGTASINTSGNLTIEPPSSGFVGAFNVVVSVTDGLLSTSQTVTVTSTDTAPTLSVTQDSATVTPGSTLSVSPGSFPLSDTTTASAAGSQDVTTMATVSSYDPLFTLEQQYRFQGVGYFTAGSSAYVLSAAGNNNFDNSYYLLSTTGVLYAYDGSGNYATSFARTPVATLGAEVYSDPTLLTNAQPPIDYSQYYSLQQQYQLTGVGTFTAGTTAFVLHSNQSGAGVGGYYLLTPSGNLYAYDGSGNYNTSIANSANLVASLDPGVFVNPSLLLDAEASPSMYPQLQQVEQQFDLQELSGGFYVGLMGNAAKWLYSPVANSYGQHYYTLVLSAVTDQALLFAWNGGTSSVPTGATPVATLDSSVYYNPALLLDAKAPEAATGVTVGVTPTGANPSPENGTLSISAPASFVGTLQVTVTATDGALSTSETFQIASTDTPPAPTAITSPQSASASGSPLVLNLTSTSAGNSPVTYTATAESAPYALQQEYQFTGLGLFTAGGVTAYVLHSNVAGGVGGYYLLTNTGAVYAYDGSGSYASTIADNYNLVAQLSPNVYTTPTLLTQATEPTLPANLLTVNDSASPATLAVNAAGIAPGTQLVVFVTASDGAEITRFSFLVNVTA